MSEVEPKTTKSKKAISKSTLVVSVLLALVCGVVLGFAYGSNKTEAELNAKYQQQANDAKQDVEKQKDAASDEIEEGQAAVAEGQQSLQQLQQENAQLKSTISTQNQKIADLEKQLQDAQSNPSQSPSPSPQSN